jgi:hypothetical protein
MSSIDVVCAPTTGGWACVVMASDGRGSTRHEVSVTAADLARLAPRAAEPTDLVRRSFEFLLEREPKESILRSFELPVIGRYFSEYDREISRR